MLKLEGKVAARWEKQSHQLPEVPGLPAFRPCWFLPCLPHPSPKHLLQQNCCSFCHLNSNPISEIDGWCCPWGHCVTSAQCSAGSGSIIIMGCLGGPGLCRLLTQVPLCFLTCRHCLFKNKIDLTAWETFGIFKIFFGTVSLPRW